MQDTMTLQKIPTTGESRLYRSSVHLHTNNSKQSLQSFAVDFMRPIEEEDHHHLKKSIGSETFTKVCIELSSRKGNRESDSAFKKQGFFL